VDESLIARSCAETIGRASAEFVRAVSGFSIGGVPPIDHINVMETYMDEDLLRYKSIWAAAGTPNAVFELTPLDLQKMTQGIVVKVKIRAG